MEYKEKGRERVTCTCVYIVNKDWKSSSAVVEELYTYYATTIFIFGNIK